MSKLFKLKEWLTVPDAARHLSIAFGEEVSEPDVLRLALDGHLKLSVNFVNHASARRGKIIPWEETEWKMFPKFDFGTKPEVTAPPELATPSPEKIMECPPNLLKAWDEIPEDERDKFSPLLTSLNIDGKRFLNLSRKVVSIADIWDLPMIGSERLDVEHLYQQLTGGPEVTLTGIDGAFVEREDGVVCQLQDDFEDNEYCAGSKAQLRKLEERIEIKKIKGEEAQKLLDKHKQDRKIFLEGRSSKDNSHKYFPAGGLPKDGVLVVRTTALRDFEQATNNAPSNADKPLTASERDSLLKLVIGMAMKGYSYDPNAKKNSAVADIAADLALLGLPLGDDTIRKYLKQGNEQLPAKPTNT